MNSANPVRAMLAGLVGTVIITVLIYAGPLVGLPEMDIAALIGWFLTGMQPAPWTSVWWLGMLEHFVNGAVIFPLAYAYALYPLLPGQPLVKGLIWGALLFLFAQAVVVPLIFCLGFFSHFYFDEQPAVLLSSLAGHLVYGGVFGVIAGEQAARFPWPTSRLPAGARSP